MRILFITHNLFGRDGWSRYGLDLAGRLAKDGGGYEILVAVNEINNDYPIDQVAVLDSPMKHLGNVPLIFLTSLKIGALCRAYRPDIVHFIVEPYFLCWPFVWAGNTRSLLTVHGTYAYTPNVISGRFGRLVIEYIYTAGLRKVSAISADSNYTAKYLLANIDGRFRNTITAKTKIITNGVDIGRFRKPNLADKDAGTHKNILFVGQVKPRKGVLEAVMAVDRYKIKYGGNFTFNIVGEYGGDDNYILSLNTYIKEHGLSDNIKFLGSVSHKKLAELYADADLFIMLSINSGHNFEGFGLVYLEANAAGVPCLGSTNCGAEDAIAHGKTGYVVDPTDHDTAAERIHDIVDLHKISRNACVGWAADNSVEKQAAKFRDFYTEIMSGC